VTYAEFQADWERAAGAEYEAYMGRSAAELVADARAGRYGECYQLWRAIAARATLPLAGQVLLEVLRRDDPYLVRYHAAKALLALLGTAELAPVDLSADRAGQPARLDVVEQMLRARLEAGGTA
jgi:hypothetical protein